MASGIHFVLEDRPNAFTDRKQLKAWLGAVANSEKKEITELNFVLMSDEALLAYNKSYLDHDYYTDVITFDNSEQTNLLAGDILISIDRVTDNALENKVVLFTELKRVMVHGVLHLCGHSDKTPQQETQMRELEDKYLARYPG